jgi:hypothetical protein
MKIYKSIDFDYCKDYIEFNWNLYVQVKFLRLIYNVILKHKIKF